MKKWCPLCLMVLFILTIEIVWGIVCVPWKSFTFSLYDIVIIFFIFITISAGWNIIYRLLKASENNKRYKTQYLKIKRNPAIFNQLWLQNHNINMNDKRLDAFNEKKKLSHSPFRIVEILNPYCSSCRDAFISLKKLKEKVGEQIEDMILFAGYPNGKNNIQNFVIVYLYALYLSKGKEIFYEAIEYWINNHDYNLLRKKFPIAQYNEDKLWEIFDEQSQWVKEEKILYTPTIIFNDRILPLGYTIEDLYYLINDMGESYS